MQIKTNILFVNNTQKYLQEVLAVYGYKINYCKDFENQDYSKYDLIILDLNTKAKNDLIKSAKKIRKKINNPIIIITDEQTKEEKIINSLNDWAEDYIKKPYTIPMLTAKINAVTRNYRRLPQKKSINICKNSVNPLTKREKDVLLLVAKGKSNKKIADTLVLSEVTIKSHLNTIFRKLQVQNRTQAVLTAIEKDIIDK